MQTNKQTNKHHRQQKGRLSFDLRWSLISTRLQIFTYLYHWFRIVYSCSPRSTFLSLKHASNVADLVELNEPRHKSKERHLIFRINYLNHLMNSLLSPLPANIPVSTWNRATIGPPAKPHSNGVSPAGR